ncbi:hypothetical protein D3C78_1551310 [compost metagenome]
MHLAVFIANDDHGIFQINQIFLFQACKLQKHPVGHFRSVKTNNDEFGHSSSP